MIARANGTFLPVVLQLETVLRKTTRGHMEDALVSISDDLATVFKETMARIDRLPEDHRLLAKRVLSWLVYAKAGLTSEELGDALSVSESVKMGYASWSPRYRPPSKMMGNCCQGLVVLEPVTNRLSFAHYTVQEYLERHAEELFPGAKEDISSTCLLYLLYEDFDSGPCSRKEDVYKRVTKYPFMRYAARYWGKHVALTEQHPAVSELLSRFLEQGASTAAACQVMQYDRGFKDQYWDLD
ncbi:nacht and ankyrin domain protein [Colletotrichum sp. SAR 10_66]|nr:nacht and ankyrin domain protein [Colletotrichum sp. SAR 10_66]